jgi:hypothetical protein
MTTLTNTRTPPPQALYNKLVRYRLWQWDPAQIICGLAYVAAQAVVHLIVTLHMVCWRIAKHVLDCAVVASATTEDGKREGTVANPLAPRVVCQYLCSQASA